MANPILSICIPTFNRAECLRQCLSTITAQFDDLETYHQTEIIISNNGSEDNTEEVVNFFLAKFSNIVYLKNRENLGFDRNVLQAVTKAKGEYVWLLGDDDGILPDSLKYVLPILNNNKFEYILLNGWGYDNKLEKQAVSYPYLSLPKNLEFLRLSEYVRTGIDHKNLVGTFGGMSAQMFKRKTWLDFPEYKKFIGSNAIHLFAILKVFKEKPCCVLARPMYMARSDNMRWETFPGLETLAKRTRGTNDTLEWILKEYEISYSPLAFKFNYFWQTAKSGFVSMVRKYFLRSQKVRNLLKKFLNK